MKKCKFISGLLVLSMLLTTIFVSPITVSAKLLESDDFKDISLEIKGAVGNGLKVGQVAKSPDGIFDVICTDNNGYEWQIWPSASYWKDSSGNKLGTTAVAANSSYKLHLCVIPVIKDVDIAYEDCILMSNVNSVKLNGKELTKDVEYSRAELGTGIYIDVSFYYVSIENSNAAQTGYYLMGEEVPVTAQTVDGQHFSGWYGTYFTGAGAQSVNFADSKLADTTFTVPYSSTIVSVRGSYEAHTQEIIDAVAPTCTTKGRTAGIKCSKCGEIIKAPESVSAKDHTAKYTTTKATTGKDGKIVKSCSDCGKTLGIKAIPKVTNVKLSASSCTYNGKVRTPSVIVKDRTGKNLVKNTDYTVKYSSGRKNVGKYAVKVTFKGNYSGEKTLYFTINPKGTNFVNKVAGFKKFAVRWTKQSVQTTGYQVQCSSSSKFITRDSVSLL